MGGSRGQAAAFPRPEPHPCPLSHRPPTVRERGTRLRRCCLGCVYGYGNMFCRGGPAGPPPAGGGPVGDFPPPRRPPRGAPTANPPFPLCFTTPTPPTRPPPP